MRGREARLGAMRLSSMAWTALAFLARGGGGGNGGVRVAEAFLPIGPEVFEKGGKLPLYVNELTSIRKQAPLDHYQ